MGTCQECRYSNPSVESHLTRCYHEDSTTPGHPMPRPFSWCDHFECRRQYYRLKQPAYIMPHKTLGRSEVHFGTQIMVLYEDHICEIFEKVPLCAATTTACIKDILP